MDSIGNNRLGYLIFGLSVITLVLLSASLISSFFGEKSMLFSDDSSSLDASDLQRTVLEQPGQRGHQIGLMCGTASQLGELICHGSIICSCGWLPQPGEPIDPEVWTEPYDTDTSVDPEPDGCFDNLVVDCDPVTINPATPANSLCAVSLSHMDKATDDMCPGGGDVCQVKNVIEGGIVVVNTNGETCCYGTRTVNCEPRDQPLPGFIDDEPVKV